VSFWQKGISGKADLLMKLTTGVADIFLPEQN